jgi:hypothetical protein
VTPATAWAVEAHLVTCAAVASRCGSPNVPVSAYTSIIGMALLFSRRHYDRRHTSGGMLIVIGEREDRWAATYGTG